MDASNVLFAIRGSRMIRATQILDSLKFDEKILFKSAVRKRDETQPDLNSYRQFVGRSRSRTAPEV